MPPPLPRLGLILPYEGRVELSNITTVARAADHAGFHSGWVGDHILFPRTAGSASPTTRTGAYPGGNEIPRHDAFGVLYTAAAVTTRLRVGVGTAIAGYRPAPALARTIATLDHLSGGRAHLALGLGWLREEFEALGVPFSQRRTRLLETVEICRRLWRDESPEFAGEHHRFGPSVFEPKPKQADLPIWLGGHSEPALHRAGLIDDGWYGSRLLPHELPPIVERLDAARADAGRLDAPFDVATTRLVTPGRTSEDGLTLGLADREALRAELEAYGAANAGLVVLIVDPQREPDMLRVIDICGELIADS